MSRHGRHVPTSFYTRFAADVGAFADEHACIAGRVVSVLEGGYSDQALASGSGAWVGGLVGLGGGDIASTRNTWSVDNVGEVRDMEIQLPTNVLILFNSWKSLSSLSIRLAPNFDILTYPWRTQAGLSELVRSSRHSIHPSSLYSLPFTILVHNPTQCPRPLLCR